jgi:hypothetical protein
MPSPEDGASRPFIDAGGMEAKTPDQLVARAAAQAAPGILETGETRGAGVSDDNPRGRGDMGLPRRTGPEVGIHAPEPPQEPRAPVHRVFEQLPTTFGRRKRRVRQVPGRRRDVLHIERD